MRNRRVDPQNQLTDFLRIVLVNEAQKEIRAKLIEVRDIGRIKNERDCDVAASYHLENLERLAVSELRSADDRVHTRAALDDCPCANDRKARDHVELTIASNEPGQQEVV